MSNSPEKSPREIIDAYSPIIRGHKGPIGFLLKAIARPLEIARNMLGAIARFPIGFGYENTAGQIVTDCPATVADTFHRMEQKLQASFNTATQPHASPIERETFLRLADDVRTDSVVLSKHCTVLRTEFDSVTERYNFIVMKEPLGKGAYKKLDLEASVAAIKRQIHGTADEVAAEVSEGLKNPVTIRRKPLDLRNIEQPGN